MKKVIFSIVLVALFALGLTSCGSGEKCPAYSQVEQTGDIPA